MSFSFPPFRSFTPSFPAANVPAGPPTSMPNFDEPELDEGGVDPMDETDEADDADQSDDEMA